MANNDDEVLLKARNSLQSEVDKVHKKLEPLYAERDKALKKIEDLKAKLQDDVNFEIKEIEREELIPLRNKLARMARAMGGRSLGDAA